MKKVRFLALILSLVFMISVVGCGDNSETKTETGNNSTIMIAGWLMDSSESLLAEKTVKLTNTDTSAEVTAVTNANGEYYFTGIDAGDYTISVAGDDDSDIASETTYSVTDGQSLYLKVIFDGSALDISVINEDGSVSTDDDDENTDDDEVTTDDEDADDATDDSTTDSKSNTTSSKNTTTTSSKKSTTTSSKNSTTTSSKNSTTTSSKKSTTTSSSKSNTDEVIASLKGTKIKMLDWNGMENVTGAKNVIKKFQNKYGVEVEYIVKAYDSYTSALASMVAADEAPDVVRLRDLDPAYLKNLQSIEVTGIDLSDDIWDDRVTDYYTVDGNIYGVNRADTLIQLPTVIYYNTSLITKYSLDDPYELWKTGEWTFDKFISMCKEFKDEAGSEYTAWSPYNVLYFASQSGYPLAYAKNGRIVDNYNSNAIKATQTLLGYKDSGIAGSFCNESDFTQGKILFLEGSIIGVRRTHFALSSMTGSVSAVPYPAFTNAKAGAVERVVYQECQAFGIAKGAKNPKAVPYFLEMYLDPDNYESKTFFADSKILEVYKSQMKCEDYYFFDDVICPLSSAGGKYALEDYNDLAAATAEQVNTIMSQMKAPYQKGIEKMNSDLAAMK